jgi:hypothetical protein
VCMINIDLLNVSSSALFATATDNANSLQWGAQRAKTL